MKRIILYLLLLVTSPSALLASLSCEADSLLHELDRVLAEGTTYMRQKEQRIDRLNMLLERESSPDKQYELRYNIIDEYKSYISDSALVYINRNLRLAQEQGQQLWEIRANLQYSFVLSSSGLFIESERVMSDIPLPLLPNSLRTEYYKCMEMLYVNIAIYQADKNLFINFDEKIHSCRDSILHYLPPTSAERLFYQFLLAESEDRDVEAREYLETYLQSLHPGTHEHARKSYSLAVLYGKLGEPVPSSRYLVQAVMSDVKDAVKENRALLDLSIWLYEQGEIEKAFDYIQYALNDANFYNARFRYFEISKALPIITDSYQQLRDRQSDFLIASLCIISLLFVLLLIVLTYLQKQMSALKLARKGLHETNQNLGVINNKLNSLNRELSEANLIKEEYVGYFLDLCSEYIGNLEDYRKLVSNKVAAKRFDELLRLSASSSVKGSEIKELFANFDKAFLNIYPNFVSSLNELLKVDERFESRRGELLNTELRIFALIRLGITDSAKIASFLRCSLQTVYNYRSKIKRCSLDESIDIEEQIRKIGAHKIDA